MASSLEIQIFKNELVQTEAQLADVKAKLQNDPTNANYLDVKAQCEALIQMLLENIGDQGQPAPEPEPEPEPEPKWSKEKHPAFQIKAGQGVSTGGNGETLATTPVSYQVGQKVEAKWEDRKFYHATIISSSGSASKPQLVVRFQIDNTTQTITNLSDLRPIADRKRKADSSADAIAPPPPPPAKPGVITAAANIDQTLANQAKKEPSKVSDGPTRPAKAPKKLQKSKELNGRKDSWQSWQGKGGKKSKESQFRTSDKPNARVGFTGSGHEMRKDPTRTRNIYAPASDEEP
ncbi:MAG: hypothetical protein M1828_002369 [Chrysothrix sp. TS-e1954]|nr:MAG: hypothetical protein M1828_002369 [Chrysothrix sp. TS-e1954]